MGDRRFSALEAERILARAAELSRQDEDAVLSATDLERIAVETGLEPAHVRRAISERDHAAVSVWLGAPATVELEEEVATPGRPDGYSERWIGSRTRVSIASQGGRTRVRIRARFGHWVGALFGGVGGGAGFGIGGPLFALVLVTSGSFLLATVAGLSAVLLAVGGARAIFGAMVRARLRRLEALMFDLAGEAGERGR